MLTVNIRFPSLSPVITVITNVQVTREDLVQDGVHRSKMEDENVKYEKDSHRASNSPDTKEWAEQLNDHNEPDDLSNETSSMGPNTELEKGPKSRNIVHNGNSAHKYQQGTSLQQHSAYFDPDGDGIIWPWDTYQGCRNFGWGRCMS